MDDDSRQKTWEAERRKMHHFPLTTAAEVIDLDSQARFSVRTTDVGPGGCFLDAVFPLPVGSSVRVILHQGLKDFHADGKVVYSQPGIGMGVAFDELDSEQRLSLLGFME